MSHYIIQKLTDFDFILNVEMILLFNDPNSLQEEIYHNMWIIDIDHEFAPEIRLQDLNTFLEKLLQNRCLQMQETYPNLKATFYIWYDPQSVQLKFNILSGANITLPFGCKLNLLNNPLPILQMFLKDVQADPHPLDFQNFTFVNPGDPGWDEDDDDDGPEWIQDVYVTTLPQEPLENERL